MQLVYCSRLLTLNIIKMKTIYLCEKDFKKIEAIETFPNENIIIGIINNEKCTVKKSCTIIIEKPTESQCNWHGLDKNSFTLRSTNGFFPTDLLMGVVNKRYSDTLKIGACIGNNLGTASIAVIDLDKAKKILIKNNFKLT